LTLFNQEGSGQARGLWTDRDRPRFGAAIPTQVMLIHRYLSASESVTMLRVLPLITRPKLAGLTLARAIDQTGSRASGWWLRWHTLRDPIAFADLLRS